MMRALLLLVYTGPALAHPSERGLVMLLPTGLYMFGGAAAVALSFAVVALLPSPAFSKLGVPREVLPPTRSESILPSALTLTLLALLVVAGYAGSRDPLANPLPLSVWTLWWVGFTFLVVLFGDLWVVFNPWRAAYRIIAKPGPRFQYPQRLGDWPRGGMGFQALRRLGGEFGRRRRPLDRLSDHGTASF